ncbi:hypothetical protein [Peribacillus simplex]|uniref:hypothetical protein n=1 Tax=Peribacillus simplex TaxID=1478 RepID=UPI003D2A43B0
MGLFFEKRESSTKPFIQIRYLVVIAMGLILIFSLINGFNLNFIKYIILLSGIGSIIDGIESIKNENKKQMLLDFSFAVIWFAVFLMYVGSEHLR